MIPGVLPASGLHKPGGVAGFVVPDRAGRGVAEPPVRGDAIWSRQAAPRQGLLDPAADLRLVRRIGGEEHAQPHLVPGPRTVSAGVMRR